MLDCDQTLERLNLFVDGELRGDARAEMEAHLADCTECSAAADALRRQHVLLRDAFSPRRSAAADVAARVAKIVESETRPLVAPAGERVAGRARLSRGASLLTAAAAGFLVAVLLFRPWRTDETPRADVVAQPLARLVVATGPVETCAAPALEWLACPTNAPLAADAKLRTGSAAQCEIATAAGCAVRLDYNTEVGLRDDERLEVEHGRVLSAVAADAPPLEIKSKDGAVVARPGATLGFTCTPERTLVTVVSGEAEVPSVRGTTRIGAGNRVAVVGGRMVDDGEACNALLDTSWANCVLAEANPEHPELIARVDRLLAEVGAAKLSLLYEDELRRLGDSGAPPLLKYLAATRDAEQQSPREKAAEIVADVSQPRRIPELIALLSDPNLQVRYFAAQGLKRLTGRDQGCSPAEWQAAIPTACTPARDDWIAWWNENRHRYPGAGKVSASEPAPR